MQEPRTAYRVPALPVRNLILKWLGEDGNDMNHLAALLFPNLKTRAGKDKLHYILQARRDTMDFDIADLILCRLDSPERWLEDPVLYEAYCAVDLITLDRVRPTCEEAA